ncbi:MAG TPA: hypothetical protein PKD05_18720 [Candidatus Melainabacteria bacterium]|nr:hypothetical protein [Candidatus Melainabacteria bacterium]
MNTTRSSQNPHQSASLDNHPNPMDRNRSILWARYLVDTEDWLLISVKETTSTAEQTRVSVEESENPIVSISVTDASGKAIYEALVKPEGIVNNELISEHELETGTLFNAQPYSVIRDSVVRLTSSKDVLSWNFDKVRGTFERLDRLNNMPPHEWRGNSVSHQYARFLGDKEGDKPGYLMPQLKLRGRSARAENQAVFEVVKEIAASSQYTDPLTSGKPGWTAEFYRPKLTASEKFKNFFNKK